MLSNLTAMNIFGFILFKGFTCIVIIELQDNPVLGARNKWIQIYNFRDP